MSKAAAVQEIFEASYGRKLSSTEEKFLESVGLSIRNDGNTIFLEKNDGTVITSIPYLTVGSPGKSDWDKCDSDFSGLKI